VTSHRLSLAVAVLGCLLLGGTKILAMPAPASADRPLMVDGPGLVRLAQAQPSPAPTPDAQAPAAAPSDQQIPADEPIGNVASLTGVATVTRNNAATPLQLKDDIYLNDVVETQASSSLGITFNDATTFRLSANAQITIDNYVYEENGSNNAGAFDIAKGTIAFVAASVAKTGNMQITTPTATLGIRGTTGVVEVPEGATTANNVNIKLYPDADGRVGRIELNDRQGARLGVLTQGASGFAVRPGAAGGRFAAVPLTITPQQQQRDQGFVRQVHATQTAGRQIVTEQRAFRRANPGLNNRNNPARQPGPPQQPNQNRPPQPGQPGQNRPGQPPQPGAPNNRQGQQPPQPGRPRAGQNGTPANPAQPGTPPRPGQNATPTTPAQPGTPPRPGQNATPTTPAQPGTPPLPGQNALPTTPAQPGTPPRPGQNANPATPAQPGAPPRPGQNALPATPTPPGTPPRPGQNALPANPAQPGTPPRPGQNVVPAQPGAPPRTTPAAPPLPNGQPLLRQPGQQFAPGAPRPGLLNRPGVPRPRQGPPPKDKKKKP